MSAWRLAGFHGVVLAAALTLLGCGAGSGGDGGALDHIGGRWSCTDPNGQVWAYDFRDSTKIRFSIDDQKATYDVLDVQVDGDVTTVTVDAILRGLGGEGSTITITRTGERLVTISSGLHAPLPFGEN